MCVPKSFKIGIIFRRRIEKKTRCAKLICPIGTDGFRGLLKTGPVARSKIKVIWPYALFQVLTMIVVTAWRTCILNQSPPGMILDGELPAIYIRIHEERYESSQKSLSRNITCHATMIWDSTAQVYDSRLKDMKKRLRKMTPSGCYWHDDIIGHVYT